MPSAPSPINDVSDNRHSNLTMYNTLYQNYKFKEIEMDTYYGSMVLF